MKDLLTPPPATKVGEPLGRLLGYIGNGETREQIRERYKSGELAGCDLGLLKAYLDEAGL